MLPLAHAVNEGSDQPAHPLSLARGITAHVHNEDACLKLGLLSHYVAVYNTPMNTATIVCFVIRK